MDTKNLLKELDPGIKIKASKEEIQTLRDAAEICDKLRLAFSEMKIFDSKEPEKAYEILLGLADIIEDYKMGEKCDE